MMEEFVIPATPGKARRLMEIANVGQVSLCDEIRALSREGLEDFAGYPAFTDLQRAATQRLIDCDLRGVLLSDGDNDARPVIFAAAALTGVRPIIICSRNPKAWKQEAESLGLSVGINPVEQPDVLIVDRAGLIRQDVIESRRDGLLVLENYDRSNDITGSGDVTGPAREFARTVVVANFRPMTRIFHSWTRQCDSVLQLLLTDLWPNEALGVLNQNHGSTTYMRDRGFRKVRPADLYPLFNVVFDLLGDRVPG